MASWVWWALGLLLFVYLVLVAFTWLISMGVAWVLRGVTRRFRENAKAR